MAHLRFKNAVVKGYYDTAQQFLLDNQILSGKTGYFVLTPLN
jgi:surfeit locus 1 family protein